MHKLAILASGSGSNAEAIMEYFEQNADVRAQIVISNNKRAGVLDRARKFNVNTQVFSSLESKEGLLLKCLQEEKIDFIILAGYMKLIPNEITSFYDGKILNIHPALLPKYGGKGMYGMNVHDAVVAAGESESGITIHYVNRNYDEGNIIFQDKVTIDKGDTAEQVQKKVLALEHYHYPRIIEKVIANIN